MRYLLSPGIEMQTVVRWCAVLLLGLAAAETDLRSGRVPNRLLVPFWVAGVCLSLLAGGISGLMDGVVGCLIMGGPYVVFFVWAGGGAGDAKLMGTAGMLLGGRYALLALGCVAFLGIMAAILTALVRGVFLNVFRNIGVLIRDAFLDVVILRNFRNFNLLPPEGNSTGTIPYAVVVYLGLCMAAGGVMLWPV